MPPLIPHAFIFHVAAAIAAVYATVLRIRHHHIMFSCLMLRRLFSLTCLMLPLRHAAC